jgi:NAD(P)-dependent dehydrogenase (short-subunit alcohol dehydrogenase family)
MKLNNQTAFVTGASRGIGRAIALAMAQEGANVAITGRDLGELNALRGEIVALGRQCLVGALDLADLSAAEQFYDQAETHFGRVDILVNNAGVGSSANPKPVVNFDDAFWDYTLRVNLTAPYRLCKRAVKYMIPRNYGRIITIASIAGKTGTLHGAAYSASKHGVLGLTRSLAMEVVKNGITVNAICPGVVKSLMNDKRLSYDAQRLGKTFADIENNATPLGRRITPEEIAVFAVTLAMPEASAATGQAFVIDAGAMNS